MRLGRSSRLRSVPKNTGTTAQSLAGAALGLAGGAGTGATERVARRAAPSLSPPLVMASLLASTPGGIGGGAGAPTGAGGGDAAGGGGGGGDGAPGTRSAGATDRFMAKVLRLPSAPVGSVGGAEPIFGEGAIGRTVGADPTRGGVSLAKVDRL